MQFPEKLQKTVRKHRDIKLVTIEIMNYLVSEPKLINKSHTTDHFLKIY